MLDELFDMESRGWYTPSMKHFILLSAGLAALCGCVTVGKQFPAPGGAVAIQVNKTTQDEIQKTYGTPDMQGTEDGDATWTYLYIQAKAFSPAIAEHLTLRFNKDGTVRSYNFNSNLAPSK